MFSRRRSSRALTRPQDLFLPAALIVAALTGRQNAALYLYMTLTLTRLCAISAATNLRSTFAMQPSIRYVQGSLLTALLLQLSGCVVALPIWRALRPATALLPFLPCGLSLNIEHMFYEYLFAVNEKESAALCHSLTALLTLTGLLLGPSSGPSAAWLSVTTGLSALMSLIVGTFLGGALRPRLSAEVLRRAPIAMLRTAIYPILYAAIARLSGIVVASPLPFFFGLGLYELCGAPFRRSPSESAPMNLALSVVCVVASCVALPFIPGFFLAGIKYLRIIPHICQALILAAICGYAMYGSFSVTFPRKNPRKSCL